MTIAEIEGLVRGGESARPEFKATTGQLRRGAETLCAFLNADGGQVLFGVTSKGDIVGQRVSDNTLRDVAAALQRFDPPAPVSMERVSLGRSGHELLVLTASPTDAPRVFTYDGRPYQRVGTTTSVMPQERYQGLLLERAHARHRWENAVTDEESGALDSEEVLRTVRIGVAAGRLPETLVGVDEALDRFGLWIGMKPTNAAVVLFGRTFFAELPPAPTAHGAIPGLDQI